jgi:hypothetical protein
MKNADGRLAYRHSHQPHRRVPMAEPQRVPPREIYPNVASGKTLLVCAYDDDAKFQRLNLAGAISLSEFRVRLPKLPLDQEIVFYCA